MTEYAYTFESFSVDERSLAAVLGIDYDELLKDRERAQEERIGIHGDEAQEIRLALDELQRETIRAMVGLGEGETPSEHTHHAR